MALLLSILGWASQRKARNAGASALPKNGAVGVNWSNLSYVIPGSSGGSGLTKLWSTQADDKVILDNVSGHIEPGNMLAILGPSGAYHLYSDYKTY